MKHREVSKSGLAASEREDAVTFSLGASGARSHGQLDPLGATDEPFCNQVYKRKTKIKRMHVPDTEVFRRAQRVSPWMVAGARRARGDHVEARRS
jgi:hypothetical protein